MAVIRPLYIDRDEGVGSIITRISNIGDKTVALVFPPGSEVFDSVVEVKFLKKQLEGLKKEIIVITRDRKQEELANSLGFKIKRDLEDEDQEEFLESFYKKKEKKGGKKKTQSSSQKERVRASQSGPKKDKLRVSDIVSPRHKPQAPDKGKEKEKEAQREEPPSEERIDFKLGGWLEKFALSGGVKRFTIGVLCLSVVVFILCLTFVFPHAKLSVYPDQLSKEAEFRLTVDEGVASPDLEKGLIPGEVFSLKKEATQTFQATGEKEVEQKAHGTIKIYNSYSSEPQTLVRTTRFLSEGGELFRIPETVVVPGAKIENGDIKPTYIKTEVYADEPGAEYNIEPTKFSIPGFKGYPKYDRFYGASEDPMKGGKVGKVAYITEEDKEKAQESLKENLLREAKKSLRERIAKDLTIVDQALEASIQSSQVSPEVGERSKRFEVTLKARAQAFAFRPHYVRRLAEERIGKKVPSHYVLLEDRFKATYTEPALNFEEGKASFKVKADLEAAWDVDNKEVKEMLRGNNEVQARKAVSDFSEIKTLKVKLWPFWLRSIPEDKSKIEIEVKYQ